MAHQILRLRAFLGTYWTRGVPGRPTPQSVQVLMLRWWLVALAFKLLGSSWDVSWHFKWLRDDMAPPHLLNTVGTGIAIALVLTHSFTGYGMDRVSLRILQWGTGMFIMAAPIDIINHRINGLDLTSWSPSHGLLYLGTAIMIVGVIRTWYLAYPRTGTFGWQWPVGLTALFTFFFENAHFAQLQQEYGILEMASWFRGQPYAEPSLLSFAADQLGRPVDAVALQGFALPIPPWVYPAWALVVCVPILLVARNMVGKIWTATAITVAYVLYRSLIWPLLVVSTFPPSVVPFWMIGVGIGVDLLCVVRMNAYLRAVLGGLVVTGIGYGALWLQTVLTGTPTDLASQTVQAMQDGYAGGAGNALSMVPVSFASALWVLPLAVLSWLGATLLLQRTVGLDSIRPPALGVEFSAEPARNPDGTLKGTPYQVDPAAAPVRKRRHATRA